MAKTKIVCTIGPASCEPDAISALLGAGMDMARLNFSHGDSAVHRQWFGRLREAAALRGQPLAILQDLSGPKIRIGTFKEPRVFLRPGQRFTLTSEDTDGDESRVFVPLPQLADWARDTRRLLLADGVIELHVDEVSGSEVHTTVAVGGWLTSHKGLSFAGRELPIPALTDKDRADLEVGLGLGVDFVALSFVRSHTDVLELRKLIEAAGSCAEIIAKLERPEALDDLEAILDAADGVMVARGDLALEIAPEHVPLAQKRIIRQAQLAGKYAITATQMLESMQHHTWPSRAEASDVANAVIDGTDAVMLSGETATGDHPALVVQMMERILLQAENSEWVQRERRRHPGVHYGSVPRALAWSVAELADMVQAKAICAFTQSGKTAQLISKTRPGVPVLGLSPHGYVLRQLALAHGVLPTQTTQVDELSEMLGEADRCLRTSGLAANGDLVVVSAGFPAGPPYRTNLAIVHQVGSS